MELKVYGKVKGIEACGTEAGATGGVASGAEETGGDTGDTGAGGPPSVLSYRGQVPTRTIIIWLILI